VTVWTADSVQTTITVERQNAPTTAGNRVAECLCLDRWLLVRREEATLSDRGRRLGWDNGVVRRAFAMVLVGCCWIGGGVSAAAMSAVWSGPVTASPLGSFVSEPEVAIDARGDAVAAWNEQKGLGGSSLVVALRAAGADAWSAPQRLYGLTDEATTFDPQLAVAPSGAAVVAWQQLPASGPPTIAAACRESADAAWSHPAVLATGFLTTSNELGIDDRGSATLVFLAGTGRRQTVDASSLDTCARGGTWTAPLVLGRTSSEVAEPAVAVSAAGESVAVWSAFRRRPRALGPGVGGAYRFDSWVEATVRPAGTDRWRRPVRLGRETQFIYDADFGASPDGPQIAVDSSGAGIAVWEHNPRGQRLVADAATLNPARSAWEERGTVATTEAISPRVASSPTGWVTLAWETGSSRLATRSGPVTGCCWTAVTTFPGARSSFDYDLALVAGPHRAAAIGYSQNKRPVEVAVHPQGSGGWQRPVPIGLGPGHDRTDPIMQALAVGADGGLLTAWTQEFPSTTPSLLDAPLYTAVSSEP
jgi:hypothetical protein